MGSGEPMYIRRPFSLVLGAALFAAALPAPAGAQIYYWRDPSGGLVLSSEPQDPSAKTYEVRERANIRTTAPVNNQRAALYDGLIEKHARAHDMDANLVRAVIQAESAFNPRAVSHKGAMGLMQLMPATAQAYDVVDPFNPAENIRAGVAYLKSLLVKFGENVELALAAYNAGPTAVRKYGDVPPYRETQNYVKKIRRAVEAAPPKKVQIYRIVEIVDGRAVPRYSTTPIPGGELVATVRR